MNNKGIDSLFLDQLKSKNNIVDTIAKYITLQKKGNNFWACCPFHGEKTPSFSIREDNQYYHCFGCGESGDVIKFVQKYENVDFMTAVKMLAKSAGLEVPSYEQNDEQRKKKEQRDYCYAIMNDACEFYIKSLIETKSQQYINYIKNRSLTPDLIKTFKIGLSPDFGSLIHFMRAKGYTEDQLIEAGVAGRSEKGNVYDFYGERIIFPILNSFGEVIAFSARTIDKDSKFAKYKNTPQTSIFTKGQTLYGMNNLRELKKARGLDSVVLVEGQMDVIASYRAGVKGTIGSMGTALSIQHCDDIYKLCDKIILCMDQDDAGVAASIKAINVLRKKFFDIKVAVYDGAKDPDEYINAFGSARYQEMLTKAVPAYDFVLNNIISKYDMSLNTERSKCVSELLAFVTTMTTNSERDIYLEQVRRMTKVPIDILRNDLDKLISGDDTPNKAKVIEEYDLTPNNNIKQAIIFVLSYKLKHFDESLDDEYIKYLLKGDLKTLYELIMTKQNNHENFFISQIFDHIDITPDSEINKIINHEDNLDEIGQRKYYYDCLKAIENGYYLTENERLLHKLNSVSTTDEMEDIIKQIERISKKIKS